MCGRNRKNIKLIESTTNTAIYFPPPFSSAFRYCPQPAQRRDPNTIYITGETPQAIEQAKFRLHETLLRIRLFVKDVQVPSAKIDSILLSRMDKVRKIVEANGTFIHFPPLASRNELIRVQGLENLHVERTVRELMTLVGSIPATCSGRVTDDTQGRTILHCHLVDYAARQSPSPEPGRDPEDAHRHLRQVGGRRCF